MTEFAWHPTNPHETNVGRFLADHGVANLSDLRRSSVERPDWFWDAVVRALDVPFRTPYSSVLDVSQGIPWATWFGGGALNVAEACCDRWAAATPDATAIRWESEGGTAPGDVAAVAASPATGGTPIATPQPPPPAPVKDEKPAKAEDEAKEKDAKGSRGGCGCDA